MALIRQFLPALANCLPHFSNLLRCDEIVLNQVFKLDIQVEVQLQKLICFVGTY